MPDTAVIAVEFTTVTAMAASAPPTDSAWGTALTVLDAVAVRVTAPVLMIAEAPSSSTVAVVVDSMLESGEPEELVSGAVVAVALSVTAPP